MALSEQEKHQFFSMLSQGLIQYLLPSLQQISQQVIQQSVATAQRATPNFWSTPIVVKRDAPVDSPNEFENDQTTPAQLLAECADLLIDLNITMDEVKEKLGAAKPQRRRRSGS
jgi:uncharacterized phage infection (PIP) family protein YhgE